MKTPFYIIKRTPVNKETAELMADSLAGNCAPCRRNLQDLIDFCLSGGTEEKVYIEPGRMVRIKSMPAGAFDYDRLGVGEVCRLGDVNFSTQGVAFSIHTDEYYNCLRIKGGGNLDLSEYLELTNVK